MKKIIFKLVFAAFFSLWLVTGQAASDEWMSESAYEFSTADATLRKDKSTVMKAVMKDGMVLKFADESLKKDRSVVWQAVSQWGDAIQFADESLKQDRLLVLRALSNQGGRLSS